MGPLCLYAAVPAAEARAACDAVPGLRAISCPWGGDPAASARGAGRGPAGSGVAALVGPRRSEDVRRAALRHDRFIGRILRVSSAVVPFRFGIDAGSDLEVCDLLAVNLDLLAGRLARFHGRVEMGLKLKPSADVASCAARLEPVRALAPRAEDRRERLLRLPTGPVLEGCYLVSREAIDAFWSAVEEVRAALPGRPLLGSGPWAPYSFCDLELRPALGQPAGHPGEPRDARIAPAYAVR